MVAQGQRMAMPGWRPIDKAPRNGRSVLLWARHEIQSTIKEWKVWPEHLAP